VGSDLFPPRLLTVLWIPDLGSWLLMAKEQWTSVVGGGWPIGAGMMLAGDGGLQRMRFRQARVAKGHAQLQPEEKQQHGCL